jgi:hypothetical protein
VDFKILESFFVHASGINATFLIPADHFAAHPSALNREAMMLRRRQSPRQHGSSSRFHHTVGVKAVQTLMRQTFSS